MWVILGVLLLFRGLLAAIEAALHAISDTDARALADKSSAGRRVSALKADPEATAAALRTGMVLSGFMAAAIGAMVPPRLLDVSLARLSESTILTSFTPLLSALLVALVATLLDMSLRSAALQRAEAWALTLSFLASAAVSTLYPLVKTLIFPVKVLLRPFNAKVSFQAPPPPL